VAYRPARRYSSPGKLTPAAEGRNSGTSPGRSVSPNQGHDMHRRHAATLTANCDYLDWDDDQVAGDRWCRIHRAHFEHGRTCPDQPAKDTPR